MRDGHVPHGIEVLCDAGSATYARALREQRVHRVDADNAPCLLANGLLRPCPDDSGWLLPTPPAVALPRLLRTIADRISEHRKREDELAAAFEAFLGLDARTVSRETAALTVLNGQQRIDAAIDMAVADASHEVLTIQPGGARRPEHMAESFPRAQEILSRGARLRTLYQHTTRYSLPAVAHYERLQGDLEVRTLSEVTERLFVFDRTTAFIPASSDRSHRVALEIRHSVVVDFLVAVFYRLWGLAATMLPKSIPQPEQSDVSARQRAIAMLLTEGLTDNEIAVRLGMNVRTARVHIAKLSSRLGSHSRAQLGYLIGQSGIIPTAPSSAADRHGR
ncbi:MULTISPECIES: LuxR C-terminal-related transcriptional regulator [unclassified Streptomyces]|uniref:helix-turn-helix transcriptional regulator n=1 Tax=unclassified Streptomyces TaxID=2593676 RepID=UPI0033C66FD0